MAPQQPNYSIIWVDDFNGAAGSLPDESKWNIIESGPNQGNSEVQFYKRDPNNVSTNGTILQIKPQKPGGVWTSGRIEGKAAFNCPAGKRLILQTELRTGTMPFNMQAGVWPAFWAMGNDKRTKGVDWPQCGEWDIFENAHGADFTIATLHFGRGGGDHQVRGGGGNSDALQTFVVEEYHTWALKVNRTPTAWQDETLEWYLDGTKFFQVKGSDVGDPEIWGRVAHKSFFPLLNVAVGSNFPGGGQPDGNTTTGIGSGLQVKYVAFYRSN